MLTKFKNLAVLYLHGNNLTELKSVQACLFATVWLVSGMWVSQGLAAERVFRAVEVRFEGGYIASRVQSLYYARSRRPLRSLIFDSTRMNSLKIHGSRHY